MFKKLLALVLAGSLIHTAVGIESISAASNVEKQAERAGQVKATVSQFGIGAEVMVMLKNQPNVKGRVEGIEDEDFLLTSKREAKARRISYNQVSQINLAKLSYRAAGQPDAVEVRRVVVGLGRNKQAKLTLAEGKRLQGKIENIEQDNFTLIDSKTGATSTVAYANVNQIEGKGSFPTWGYVAIGAGVGAGVLLAVLVALYRAD